MHQRTSLVPRSRRRHRRLLRAAARLGAGVALVLAVPLALAALRLAGVAGTDGCEHVTFSVPDIDAGVRQACATSAGRPRTCAGFTVTGVLGTGADRTDGSIRGGGAGALARPGAAAGLLAVLGLPLVAGGKALRRASGDRGRRQVAR